MQRTRAFLSLAAAMFTLGCDEAPSDTNLLTIGGITRLPASQQLTVRVEQPKGVFTFTNADLAASTTVAPLQLRTAKRGTMRVRYVVTAAPTDTVADETFEFTLQDGYQYSVSGVRTPPNWLPTCFGCTSTRKAPYKGGAQPTTDSLLFYIRNDKPCRGCVY